MVGGGGGGGAQKTTVRVHVYGFVSASAKC